MSFFGEPETIKHTVGTKELVFAPITLKTLLQFKSVIKPVSSLLALVFSNGNSDTSMSNRQNTKTTQEGTDTTSEIISSAISPEILKFKMDKKEKSISEVIEILTSPQTITSLGELCLDSLRYDPDNAKFPPKDSFISLLSPQQLIEILKGISKANKNIFGDFTGVPSLGKLVTAKIKDLENQTPQDKPIPINGNK